MTPHSDPGKHASGSKSAQAARLLCAAQKVLARFTDLQAMCAGGCRGEPPCPPPAKPTLLLPPARFPTTSRPDQTAPGRLVKTPPAGNPPAAQLDRAARSNPPRREPLDRAARSNPPPQGSPASSTTPQKKTRQGLPPRVFSAAFQAVQPVSAAFQNGPFNSGLRTKAAPRCSA